MQSEMVLSTVCPFIRLLHCIPLLWHRLPKDLGDKTLEAAAAMTEYTLVTQGERWVGFGICNFKELTRGTILS